VIAEGDRDPNCRDRDAKVVDQMSISCAEILGMSQANHRAIGIITNGRDGRP